MKTHYLQSALKGLLTIAVAVALPIIVISMVISNKQTDNSEKSNSHSIQTDTIEK